MITESLYERAKIYRFQNDLARAEQMLAELEPRLRRSYPAGSYRFATLASEQSLIALARGDLQVAWRLADRAVAIVEATVKAGGAGAESLPILLDRRSTVELELGRVNEAAADAARALRQMQADAQPGTYSNVLGRGYLTLGRVLRAQCKRDEARAAFRSAAEHLESALGPDHPDTRSAKQLRDLVTP